MDRFPPLAVLMLALLGFGALGLYGCAGSEAPSGTGDGVRPQPDAPPGTAWQGDRSTAHDPQDLTARSDQDWRRLWQLAGLPAPRSLPDGQMAVAIFLGPRTGPGHAVTLEAPIPDGAGIVVPYRESVPGPDDPASDQPVSPFAVRLVAASPLPVKFVLAP